MCLVSRDAKRIVVASLHMCKIVIEIGPISRINARAHQNTRSGWIRHARVDSGNFLNIMSIPCGPTIFLFRAREELRNLDLVLFWR